MRETAPPANSAPESALARLLEVETRLESALAEARRDADAARASAEAEAAARLAGLETELAAAGGEVGARIAREAEARAAVEREALERLRARYAAVQGEVLEALAHWVAGQVLAAAGQESS